MQTVWYFMHGWHLFLNPYDIFITHYVVAQLVVFLSYSFRV